jgi:hypothetical protein
MCPPFDSSSTCVPTCGVVTFSLPKPAAFKLPRSSFAALALSFFAASIPACIFDFHASSPQLGVVSEAVQPSARFGSEGIGRGAEDIDDIDDIDGNCGEGIDGNCGGGNCGDGKDIGANGCGAQGK